MKIKSSAGFQNIWPDRAGKVDVPPNCLSAIVVAMPQPQENEQAKNVPLKRFLQKTFLATMGKPGLCERHWDCRGGIAK